MAGQEGKLAECLQDAVSYLAGVDEGEPNAENS